MNPNSSEMFALHDAKVHARAIRALRFRSRVRKTLLAAPVLVAVALVVTSRVRVEEADLPQALASAPLTVPEEKTDSRFMTDEELLAVFPAGSCFLAEVNGKKILVFHDPAVKERFGLTPRL